MGKPQPPDQERIELVINGDDPESHKQAQETARILSAPQLARTIQQRIDECRKQIAAVTTALNRCNKVTQLNLVFDKGFYSHLYMGLYPSEIEKMSYEIQVACSSALTSVGSVYVEWLVYCRDGNTKSQGFSVTGHRVIEQVLTEKLPLLVDQLKKYEEQLDDLITIVKGK